MLTPPTRHRTHQWEEWADYRPRWQMAKGESKRKCQAPFPQSIAGLLDSRWPRWGAASRTLGFVIYEPSDQQVKNLMGFVMSFLFGLMLTCGCSLSFCKNDPFREQTMS